MQDPLGQPGPISKKKIKKKEQQIENSYPKIVLQGNMSKSKQSLEDKNTSWAESTWSVCILVANYDYSFWGFGKSSHRKNQLNRKATTRCPLTTEREDNNDT